MARSARFDLARTLTHCLTTTVAHPQHL